MKTTCFRLVPNFFHFSPNKPTLKKILFCLLPARALVFSSNWTASFTTKRVLRPTPKKQKTPPSPALHNRKWGHCLKTGSIWSRGLSYWFFGWKIMQLFNRPSSLRRKIKFPPQKIPPPRSKTPLSRTISTSPMQPLPFFSLAGTGVRRTLRTRTPAATLLSGRRSSF